MTQITRFSRLRDHGVFKDFSWPKSLPEFKRFNLMYGWNGTGKTTLTNILRLIELEIDPPPLGEVIIRVDNSDFAGSGLKDLKVPIKVFNREFRDESVFQRDGGLAPIFVLGKENVVKQKEAENLKAEFAKVQENESSETELAQRAQSDLEQHGTDHGGKIREALRSPGPGSNPFNNYNRTKYVARAEKMIAEDNKTDCLLDDTTRDALLQQVQDKPKDKISTVARTLPPIDDYIQATADLLARTVISETMESLRQDNELATWVQNGLNIHISRDAKSCLFCDQPLPEERIQALEKHFSEELQRLQRDVASLQSTIEDAKGTLDFIERELPKQKDLDSSIALEYGNTLSELKDTIVQMRNYLSSLENHLQQKLKKPFDSLELKLPAIEITKTPVLKDAKAEKIFKPLVVLNDVIQKHNTICKEFDKRVNEARRKLEANLVAFSLEGYLNKKRILENHNNKAENAKKIARDLDSKIRDLESEIQDNREPAEELNQDLIQYLGHDELQLKTEDNGYIIMRRDTPVEDTLSEGEQTAIALLYFLESFRDQHFDLENGIIVLDDPVSSLDSNALFSAFGFIRERTQNAGQLFILTHNFTLFHQTKNWFDFLNKANREEQPAACYMISCRTNEKNERTSRIKKLDRLLEKYESEYHFLFSRVYGASVTEDGTTMDLLYEAPNIARRVLEAFLSFRLPGQRGGLASKVQSLRSTPEAIKTRVLRFLHTYSHNANWDAPSHDPSILGEGKDVMKAVIDLMMAEDTQHTRDMIEQAKLSLIKS